MKIRILTKKIVSSSEFFKVWGGGHIPSTCEIYQKNYKTFSHILHFQVNGTGKKISRENGFRISISVIDRFFV